MHMYRTGMTGLAAEDVIKRCKTHSIMNDLFHTFITEPI